MPAGKPAGVRCVHLSADNQCMIFGDPERPAVCGQFQADAEICGTSFTEAMTNIAALELQ